ncbi:hypothetical protein C5B96_15605 [Subtercola sp. Z020]|uniref:hypothetical protein n=1 Tax=Subtercola sp. Z020 TaxID=2080582 RepID=UPI000CE91441|nr:hypothetical protein [Subtercola sp. Z020]PPF77547.1 hypothetical protein C5B96_15605 [Subtercola sp. Z020]
MTTDETQDAPIMAGADETTPDDDAQARDTRSGDAEQLPDGSGSDGSDSEDGEDTVSGGGADDE